MSTLEDTNKRSRDSSENLEDSPSMKRVRKPKVYDDYDLTPTVNKYIFKFSLQKIKKRKNQNLKKKEKEDQNQRRRRWKRLQPRRKVKKYHLLH
jgi:hypothetical protein